MVFFATLPDFIRLPIVLLITDNTSRRIVTFCNTLSRNENAIIAHPFRQEITAMKRLKSVLMLAFVVLGAIAGASALAAHHGGHVRFGVFVGPGYWYPPPYYSYPPYYSSPYYYPPAVAAPQTYFEQGVAQPGPTQAAPAQPQGFW